MTFFGWILVLMLALGQTQTATSARPTQLHPTGRVLSTQIDPTPPILRGGTYVALGDSISAGKFAGTAVQSFPDRVAQQLGMQLVLLARSGAKAAWALPQLPTVLAAQPALVTVELGTNDAGFHTPSDVFAEQYDAILSAVARPETQVLCLGSWLPAADFDRMISEICAQHGGTFVSLDGFYAVNAYHGGAGTPTFAGLSDWFHPGNQGHAAIAAAVLSSLDGGTAPMPGIPPQRAAF